VLGIAGKRHSHKDRLKILLRLGLGLVGGPDIRVFCRCSVPFHLKLSHYCYGTGVAEIVRKRDLVEA
jgi:hypothetical protein